MKRALPRCLYFDFEANITCKIPKLDANADSDALNFEFLPTKQHVASVNYLFPWAVDYIKSKKGDRKFAWEFISDTVRESDISWDGCKLLDVMAYEIQKRIDQWVRYIDLYIFNVKDVESSRILDIIECLVWTIKGTINYTDSALRLLNVARFSDEDRLKIACVHCLSDHIERFVKLANPNNLTNLYEKTEEIINFWKIYLDKSEDTDVDESLLYNFGYLNHHAVMFVWDRLNESSKSANMVKLMENADIDLQCYLLSKMDRNQQLRMLEKCAVSIVTNMITDFVWDRYVFVTLHFGRDVISNNHYYLILKNAHRAQDTIDDVTLYKYVDLFEELWKETPERVKDYIIREVQDTRLLTHVLQTSSVDDIEKIFRQASPTFQQRLLESKGGIECFADLVIVDERYELADSLLNGVFNKTEDILNYKRTLTNGTLALCRSIRDMKSFEKLDTELNWFFPIQSEADEFKRKCMQSPCNLFQRWLPNALFSGPEFAKPRDRADFTKLNALLEWSALSSTEVQNLKAALTKKSFQFNKHFVLKLIKLERYDLVDQLLQWCLPDEKSIIQYKKQFFEETIKKNRIEFVYELLWKDEELKALDMYVNWNFVEGYERRRFKHSLKKDFCKSTPKLLSSLLYAEKFDLADQFLNWCDLIDEDEDEGIQKFKNELFLTIDLGYVTRRVGLPTDGDLKATQLIQKVIKIIAWFNPSDETYAKYGEKYMEHKMLYRALQLIMDH